MSDDRITPEDLAELERLETRFFETRAYEDDLIFTGAVGNAFPALAAMIRAQAERIAELERMLWERTEDARIARERE